MASGIVDSRIQETPIAILDFETTGLTPGYDRVVEVCVMRCVPGQAPRIVLDTLVNPLRAVAATEIHGITDTRLCHFSGYSGCVAYLIQQGI
jgi:DNA polymerase-3 subunit epsilon